MTTFVDTSALYALLDEDDSNHGPAAEWIAGPGRDPSEILATHSYIVVESLALVRARLGPSATRVLADAYLRALSIIYVDEALHVAGLRSHLAAVRRRPSFVDWISFEMMRQRGIGRAFAFDRDFTTEGFDLVP